MFPSPTPKSLVMVGVTVRPEERDAIGRAAHQRGIGVSALMREAISAHLGLPLVDPGPPGRRRKVASTVRHRTRPSPPTAA